MKKIGIIGGIGPESTLDYYKRIVELYRKKLNTENYPKIIINSINLTELVEHLYSRSFNKIVDILYSEIEILRSAGAEFAILAANTAHLIFDELREKSKLPMISIVESTHERAKKLGLKKVGLFGTRFTMQEGFYQKEFLKSKTEIIVPSPENREIVHDKYMNELVNGIFKDETRNELIAIANELKEKNHIEGLILGGTELPLILSQKDFSDLKILDTSGIHVEKIIDFAIEN